MKKETFYFSHDYNARTDRKLVNVIMKYGMAGLGVYWCIIEMLYEEGGYLPLEYERITFELRTEKNVIESIINDFDLFKNDLDKFWSVAVLERLKKRNEKSETARKSINKRWGKYKRNTNVIQTNNECNTIKERKVKENKIKENIKRKFVIPDLNEFIKYFTENNYSEYLAKKVYEHYSLADWHDTHGKPVLNWKQKVHTNWFREENKIKINKPIMP